MKSLITAAYRQCNIFNTMSHIQHPLHHHYHHRLWPLTSITNIIIITVTIMVFVISLSILQWIILQYRLWVPSFWVCAHYNDVIISTIAFQIISLTIIYSIVFSDADQRKYPSSASLAFVWGIHRGPPNSPHKWPVTRKMFPFDDVIMKVFKHITS